MISMNESSTVAAAAAPAVLAADSAGVGGTILLMVGILVGIALIIFCIGALMSIFRSPGLSRGGRLIWVIGVLVFQFFGPLAWFLVGRRTSAR